MNSVGPQSGGNVNDLTSVGEVVQHPDRADIPGQLKGRKITDVTHEAPKLTLTVDSDHSGGPQSVTLEEVPSSKPTSISIEESPSPNRITIEEEKNIATEKSKSPFLKTLRKVAKVALPKLLGVAVMTGAVIGIVALATATVVFPPVALVVAAVALGLIFYGGAHVFGTDLRDFNLPQFGGKPPTIGVQLDTILQQGDFDHSLEMFKAQGSHKVILETELDKDNLHKLDNLNKILEYCPNLTSLYLDEQFPRDNLANLKGEFTTIDFYLSPADYTKIPVLKKNNKQLDDFHIHLQRQKNEDLNFDTLKKEIETLLKDKAKVTLYDIPDDQRKSFESHFSILEKDDGSFEIKGVRDTKDQSPDAVDQSEEDQ